MPDNFVLDPHPERLIGFDAGVLVVEKFAAETEQKHDVFQAVDVVNELADAFVGVLAAHFCVAKRREAGAVYEGFQIVNAD